MHRKMLIRALAAAILMLRQRNTGYMPRQGEQAPFPPFMGYYKQHTVSFGL